MKNDKNYLKKLIIYKYLLKNKRAFVIPFMRIIINPLFIKLSDSLKNDYEKTKEILSAYIIIILIHEVVHLLKFFKTTFSFKKFLKLQKIEKKEKFLLNIYLEYQKLITLNMNKQKR